MKKTLLSLTLTVSLLAGCGPTLVRSDLELRHEPTFHTVTDHVWIEPGVAGQADLDLLLARNGARYGDRLVISAPPETVRALQDRYAMTGIRVIAAPDDDWSRNGQYRATFTRLVVTPPNCGDWSDGDTESADNKPSSHWGCAQTSNLARMVADPNDLIAGRSDETAYNTDADIVAVRAYRQHALPAVTVTGTVED